MTLVTYIEHNGTEHKIDVPNGETVMQGATHNAVNGIVAECGGGLSCATCLCIVDEAWRDKVPQPSELEQQLMEFSPNGEKPGARFSCQIVVNDDLEGLVVHIPESQY
jgi:ferredoxin, 2Fe-2S